MHSSTSVKSVKSLFSRWRLLLFVGLGLALFCFNSGLELPYFVRGYVTMLEVQTSVILFYFGWRFLLKTRSQNSSTS